MLRTLAEELPGRIGERVLVQGWVHRRRRLGAVSFLLVRDRSGVEITGPLVRALSPPAATPPVQLWRPTLDVGLPTLLDLRAVSLDVELGFIDDHRNVLAVLREVLAGMLAEIPAEDARLPGAHLPSVPDEIPVVHFRDALRRVGAEPEEPDLTPEHERLLGA